MATISNNNRTIEVITGSDSFIFQKEDLIFVTTPTKIIFHYAKISLDIDYVDITSPATDDIGALKILVQGYIDNGGVTELEENEKINNSLIISLLQKLIEEQKITNKLLTKIYN